LFASFSFETAMLRGTSYSSATDPTSPAASSELLLRTVSLLEEFCQFLQLEPGPDLEVECLMRAAVIADASFPTVYFQICAEMIELCEEVTVVGLQTVSELVIRADVQQVLDTIVNAINDTTGPTAQTIAKEICTEIIERMLASCTTRDSPFILNISQSDVSDEFVVPLTLDMNDEPVLHTEMAVEIIQITLEETAAAAECATASEIADAPVSLHLSQATVAGSNVAALTTETHRSCSPPLFEDSTTLNRGSEPTGTVDGAAECINQAAKAQLPHTQSVSQADTERPVRWEQQAVVQIDTDALMLQCGIPVFVAEPSREKYDAVSYEHGRYEQHRTVNQDGRNHQAVEDSFQQYLTDGHQTNATAERLTSYVAPEETVGDDMEHAVTQAQDQRERSCAAVVVVGDQLAQNQEQEHVQLSQQPCEPQHCTQEKPDQPQDGEKEQQRQAEEHAAFEKLWQTEKTAVEQRAEVRATVQFRQWQRDKVTLEAAIEASLRDYGELYEKVRLLRTLSVA
jgi:hypothetical protein